MKLDQHPCRSNFCNRSVDSSRSPVRRRYSELTCRRTESTIEEFKGFRTTGSSSTDPVDISRGSRPKIFLSRRRFYTRKWIKHLIQKYDLQLYLPAFKTCDNNRITRKKGKSTAKQC